MIEQIKPKLEELIPLYGLGKYCDRCREERNKCYDLNGARISEFPRDYIIEMSFYNAITGGAIGGGLLTLLSAGIEYIAK